MRMLETNESFDDVIFTDKSSKDTQKRHKDAPRKLKPKPKHPQKVHVWGGISKKGPTNIVIFSTATRYMSILEAGLLPFTRETFPFSYRFQQDNDPKHCARFTRAFFEEHHINCWRTPAESPDLKYLWLYEGVFEKLIQAEGATRSEAGDKGVLGYCCM